MPKISRAGDTIRALSARINPFIATDGLDGAIKIDAALGDDVGSRAEACLADMQKRDDLRYRFSAEEYAAEIRWNIAAN